MFLPTQTGKAWRLIGEWGVVQVGHDLSRPCTRGVDLSVSFHIFVHVDGLVGPSFVICECFYVYDILYVFVCVHAHV